VITASEQKYAMRFKRSHVRPLRAVIAKLTNAGATEHLSLFEQALDHARRGEPLIVVAESLEEIELMVQAFIVYGVRPPPSVDVLNPGN
jgi:hypothetical protein